MSGAEEDRKRAARAEQVALFRYQLIREAADPALSTRQRGRLVRELAARAHPGPFGDPVTVSRETIDRWIRAWRAGGFAALAPPARQVTPRTDAAGAGAGRRAEAGEARPHRRAGDADLAGVVRLVPVGAHAAAAFRAAGADYPPGRAPAAGLRPVRGARPNELWTGDALHGPADRRPQGVPVRLPRRPFPGGDGRPLGLLRGQRAAGRRAAPGAGRPGRPRARYTSTTAPLLSMRR